MARGVLRWWPMLAGVALAAFVAIDTSEGSDMAPILAASGLVYLAAAALGRPKADWPVFIGTFLIISASRVAARLGAGGFDATWVFLSAASAFLVYGLVRGATRPVGGLPLQSAAMVVVGVAAVLASVAGGDLGAYLVASGLLGHAAWDLYHHRVNRVVTRSMAEFCGVLDTLLALSIVVATMRS